MDLTLHRVASTNTTKILYYKYHVVVSAIQSETKEKKPRWWTLAGNVKSRFQLTVHRHIYLGSFKHLQMLPPSLLQHLRTRSWAATEFSVDLFTAPTYRPVRGVAGLNLVHLQLYLHNDSTIRSKPHIQNVRAMCWNCGWAQVHPRPSQRPNQQWSRGNQFWSTW